MSKLNTEAALPICAACSAAIAVLYPYNAKFNLIGEKLPIKYPMHYGALRARPWAPACRWPCNPTPRRPLTLRCRARVRLPRLARTHQCPRCSWPCSPPQAPSSSLSEQPALWHHRHAAARSRTAFRLIIILRPASHAVIRTRFVCGTRGLWHEPSLAQCPSAAPTVCACKRCPLAMANPPQMWWAYFTSARSAHRQDGTQGLPQGVAACE